MKVKTSIKKMCPGCYSYRYNKKNYIKCDLNPRHKQRQRFSIAVNKPILNLYWQKQEIMTFETSEIMAELI